MLNIKYNTGEGNESKGNIKYYTDFNTLIENQINNLEEGIYKENLKLLSTIINDEKTRINYIHLKSLSIVYNLLGSIKKLQYSNETIIKGLIHNLSHSFLMGEYNYDTELENNIIEHSIIHNDHLLEIIDVRNYKKIVTQILQALLIKEEDHIFIGPQFDSKIYLENVINYYCYEVRKTLLHKIKK